ncbi:MAG TPA: tryptophan 7-halogenase [Trebonia sp.]
MTIQTPKAHYDIVICGGGLAGLTMARQILIRRPGSEVLVLDRQRGPSPAAAHKVGESITEGASSFLRRTLQLGDYLAASHVAKFGLRFFYGGGSTPLEERLEYGGTQWPPIATYQLDRGTLENDLRVMVAEAGATVLAGTQILDADLAEDGRTHTIRCRRDARDFTVTARWLIDATGQRRLIARKKKLTRRVGHDISVTWWRANRQVHVDDFVAPENRAWHDRVGAPRWHSTNQLAGEGYWIWLIPLVSGATSMGIVADDSRHPLRQRHSFQQALAWCRDHEPQLADALDGASPLDFHTLRNFAYTTTQAFSEHRWACIGDAAVLTDPLYSFGIELMAHAETMVMRLIELDDAGALSAETAREYDSLYRDLFDVVQDQFTGMYDVFGSPFAATQKLAWDSSLYFALFQQSMLQDIYDGTGAPAYFSDVIRRLRPLNRAMQDLFTQLLRRTGTLQIDKGMRTWAPRVGTLADVSVHKLPHDQLPGLFAQRFDALEDIAAVISAEITRHHPPLAETVASQLLAHRAPDVTLPAQFDVERVWDLNRRAFAPVGDRFRRAALACRGRAAITELGTDGRDADGQSTYADLLARAGQAESLLSGEPGQVLGVEGRPADAAALLAGVVSAGRTAVLLDPAWDDARRREATGRCGIARTLSASGFARAAGPSGPHPPQDDALRAGPQTLMRRPAMLDCRYTEWGLEVIHLDEGALFRMEGWMDRLLRRSAPAHAVAAGLRCLWLGPVRPEMIVLLCLGHQVAVIPRNCSVGATALRRVLDEREIDVLLAPPADLRLLSADGWTRRPVTAISVGEPLPWDLTRTLRTQARTVLDFAYLSFGH